MTDPTPTMPAGWYPDPAQAGQLRYWTGAAWSQDVQPAPPSPGELVRPWWQQWWAIILCLLVCFPLGVIGVWQRKGTSVGVKVAVTVVALILYGAALAARSQS